MLKRDILENIFKKYSEIKDFYSKSLDITSKILSLLGEKEIEELAGEFDEREKNIYAAELKLKEAEGLAKQYARDNFLKDAGFDELNKISPEYASKIKKIRGEAAGVIEKLQKLDEKMRTQIENSMNEIKTRLQKTDTAKKIKKNYGFNNFKSNLIDKNI